MVTTVDNTQSAVQDDQEKADKPKPVSAQLRGETMGYAVQSIGYNLVGNLFEPYVSYRIQQRYSGSDAAHRDQHGSYTQNLAGELLGDVAGGAALIAAEAVCPTQLHDFTRKARDCIDPVYDKLAHVFLKKDCSDKEYKERVDAWKVFQERNVVRSAIIGVTGIVVNVAAQKLMLGNPSPTNVVLAGKLASTALSSALGLGARFLLPMQMNRIDQTMGKVMAPMVGDAGTPEEPAAHYSHVEKLEQQKEAASGLAVTSR